MNKKILITGGTGFIGRSLCKVFLDGGARLTVLVRDIDKAAKSIQGGVRFIHTLSELSPDEPFDSVINLAGEPVAQHWTKTARAKIMNSRLNTTQEVLDHMGGMTTKPRAYIAASAIGWYGVHEHEIFTEHSAPSTQTGGDFAKHICHEWEDLSIQAQDIGIRTVLLRIGIVLERDGGVIREVSPAFKYGFGGRMGSGKQWFSWVHRDDVIGMILHVIHDETLHGAMNVTAPDPVTNAVFAKALGAAMSRPSFMPLPAFLLKLIFGQMAQEIMLSGQNVVPEKALNHGYVFQYPDIQSALNAIVSTR